MAWFIKHYECDSCGTSWTDEWSSACDDKCPKCNLEIEPDAVEDRTIMIEKVPRAGWIVQISSASAEHTPDYVTINFGRKRAAYAFFKLVAGYTR